jgi:type II secretory pathway pseudopilin PulG
MKSRLALTLLELLIVIAVVAAILASLLPAIQRVRESSLRTRSTNNLRQIALATQQFASTNQDRLPHLVGNSLTPNYPGNSGTIFVAQTPHASGMLVSMVNGSIRTLSGLVSPEVYWGLVTPAQGEVVGLEW